jgi:dipeptidyl-peptidase-4
MAYPTKIAFSPDGQMVTYLHAEDGGLVRHLYGFDLATGQARLLLAPTGGGATEDSLSLDEKLLRERQRQLDLGVTQYAWAPTGQRLLLPFSDGLYLLDGPGAGPRLLVSAAAGPLLDPQFSPDGSWVAFVQGGDLYGLPLGGGGAAQEPRRLIEGTLENGRTRGLAEYIAQEEMGRGSGFWWSPDSRWLAFVEVDDSHIPVYRIVHQGKDTTGKGAQEDHRYPFAGQPNARVRLGVVAREGGRPLWMDLGSDPDVYLARVGWLPDGSLAAQVENRAQTRLDLLRFDLRQAGEAPTGGALWLREESPLWINLHDLFQPLKTGPYAGGFLIASERSGFRHLYLYDSRGDLVRRLTSGDWMVDSLAGVNEAAGLVYFTATKESPLECHLYVTSMAGGEPRRITRRQGMHAVTLDRACLRFVDVHDSPGQPPRVTLNALGDGAELCAIYEPSDPRVEELVLEPPELVSLTNRTGDTLYGAIYRPPAAFGSGPYPTIVSVYGGPHAQMVTRGWRMTAAMRAQALRRLGYLVFVLDNRGSARRGLAFEGGIQHRMGELEVQDQVDGVHWLIEQGLADPERVGVYGWSYGGYMAALCLARAPEVFRCAVAGAPVTHWDGYDTHYTERYMGLPGENPAGYRESSVLQHVEQITGRLMIVHGLIDENVHFRHTARLINALIAARKSYELLLFPDERHLPRKLADRVYMEEQIAAFFGRALMR